MPTSELLLLQASSMRNEEKGKERSQVVHHRLLETKIKGGVSFE